MAGYAERVEERYIVNLADEIAEVVAHGGRGSIPALQRHLSVRFGNVESKDLHRALERCQPTVREAFN